MRRSLVSASILLAATVAFVAPASAAGGVIKQLPFQGVTSSDMVVNDGVTSGTVPAGTAFSGTVTYDDAQSAAPTSFEGGTLSEYAFSSMTLTMAGSTVSFGPGAIDVYDNLVSFPGAGYPSGDSVYVNFTSGIANTMGVAPNATVDGVTFNTFGLAFLDPSATAVVNGALPADLSASMSSNMFAEFNFGTSGQPFGAGNTSMIQTLTSVGPTNSSAPAGGDDVSLARGTGSIKSVNAAKGLVIVGTSTLHVTKFTRIAHVGGTPGVALRTLKKGAKLQWTATKSKHGAWHGLSLVVH